MSNNTLESSAVKGSLQDYARQKGMQIADVIAEIEAVIMVDVSGSMGSGISGGRETKFERAVKALEYYQQEMPGKILIVTFSDVAKFCPDGKVDFDGGATNMTDALLFSHTADSIPGMNFILISDGQPNDENSALSQAKRYKNKINTVFIGDDHEPGADFLRKLSSTSGGQHVTDKDAGKLIQTLKRLLLTG